LVQSDKRRRHDYSLDLSFDGCISGLFLLLEVNHAFVAELMVNKEIHWQFPFGVKCFHNPYIVSEGATSFSRRDETT
jgi:hypothetical protein